VSIKRFFHRSDNGPTTKPPLSFDRARCSFEKHAALTMVMYPGVARDVIWHIAGSQYGLAYGILKIHARRGSDDRLAFALADFTSVIKGQWDVWEMWQKWYPILITLPHAEKDREWLVDLLAFCEILASQNIGCELHSRLECLRLTRVIRDNWYQRD
jgi:hypothetical protein